MIQWILSEILPYCKLIGTNDQICSIAWSGINDSLKVRGLRNMPHVEEFPNRFYLGWDIEGTWFRVLVINSFLLWKTVLNMISSVLCRKKKTIQYLDGWPFRNLKISEACELYQEKFVYIRNRFSKIIHNNFFFFLNG